MAKSKKGQQGDLVAAQHLRYAIEFSDAAGAEEDIDFFPAETDPEIIGVEPFDARMGFQFQATLYGKAVGGDLTLRLYGRVNVDGVVGDWVQLGGDFVVSGGAAGFSAAIEPSDGICGPNQFRLTREGGGDGSQAAVSFS